VRVAALVGDPARARMLTALMDGRALTATELALEGSVAPSTASSHLARLLAGELVAIERQGRHRYYRLSGPDVAEVLEGLMGLAVRLGGKRVRIGPKDPALRSARVCYDPRRRARRPPVRACAGAATLRARETASLTDGGRRLEPSASTEARRDTPPPPAVPRWSVRRPSPAAWARAAAQVFARAGPSAGVGRAWWSSRPRRASFARGFHRLSPVRLCPSAGGIARHAVEDACRSTGGRR
jgi:DNA-binding transcriptional ArsR family regulator